MSVQARAGAGSLRVGASVLPKWYVTGAGNTYVALLIYSKIVMLINQKRTTSSTRKLAQIKEQKDFLHQKRNMEHNILLIRASPDETQKYSAVTKSRGGKQKMRRTFHGTARNVMKSTQPPSPALARHSATRWPVTLHYLLIYVGISQLMPHSTLWDIS